MVIFVLEASIFVDVQKLCKLLMCVSYSRHR